MAPVTIRPKDQKQWNALKIIFEAMNVPFEKEEESPYNPEFVAKIKRSEEQIKEGKVTRITKENLQSFLGLE
jgi:hypothetical protein